MPFQWFLHLKRMMIQTILSALGKKTTTMLHSAVTDVVRSRMKWSEKNHTAQLIYPVRNRRVRLCSQHLYFGTCPYEEGSRRVLAVKVFTFTVLLADEHQKRSCLPGASICFWTHYRI